MASETAPDVGNGVVGMRSEPAKPVMTSIDPARRAAVANEAGTESSRLPRSIAGGFRGIGDDLDRRARDWRNMVRLLQQQGPQFDNAEAERERLYEQLTRVVAEVNESGRSLKTLLASTKNGDASSNLTASFSKNLSALDELESVAEALSTNLAAVRSNWEQYARTVIRAQKMREELKQDIGER